MVDLKSYISKFFLANALQSTGAAASNSQKKLDLTNVDTEKLQKLK